MPAPHQPHFKYKPLDDETEDIRLLRILPGPDADVLECELFNAPARGRPGYVALSYEWGDCVDHEELLVNGMQFYIQRNLYAFLLQLRSHWVDRNWDQMNLEVGALSLSIIGESLIVWVDAICIDQGTTSEKSHQVGMIHHVYRQAEAAFGWLGEEADGSAELLKWVRATSASSCDELPVRRLEEEKAHNLKAQDALTHRSYWYRLWIVQEIVLARRVIFLCGANVFPAQSLKQLGTRILGGSPASRILFLRLTTNARWRLDSLIQTLQDSRCSTVHDKIYALLGLISDPTHGTCSIPRHFVDYEMPDVELFRRTILLESSASQPENTSIDFHRLQKYFCYLGLLKQMHAAGTGQDSPAWTKPFGCLWEGVISRERLDTYVLIENAHTAEYLTSGVGDSIVDCQRLSSVDESCGLRDNKPQYCIVRLADTVTMTFLFRFDGQRWVLLGPMLASEAPEKKHLLSLGRYYSARLSVFDGVQFEWGEPLSGDWGAKPTLQVQVKMSFRLILTILTAEHGSDEMTATHHFPRLENKSFTLLEKDANIGSCSTTKLELVYAECRRCRNQRHERWSKLCGPQQGVQEFLPHYLQNTSNTTKTRRFLHQSSP